MKNLRIDESRLRKLIRKKLVEQADREEYRVVDVNDPVVAKKIAEAQKNKPEDPEKTQAARNELIKQAELLAKGASKPGVGISKTMNRKVARDLADRLYDATEGRGDGMISGAISSITFGAISGIGTNEVEVQACLSDDRIQCLADLSYVAYHYEKRYSGYTLHDTIKDEYGFFSSDDYQKNVRDPIEDAILDDGIFAIGDKVIDQDALQQMRKEAEEYSSKTEEMVAMSGMDKLHDFGQGAGSAALILGALNTAGIMFTPGVGLTAIPAAFAAGATGGMVGGIAATGLTATGTAFVPAAGAGAVTTGVSSALIPGTVATTYASGFASGIPVIGGALASIPGPGWVALGVFAVGMGLFYAFDEAPMTEQEKFVLSPDLWKKLDAMFKKQSESMMEASKSPELVVRQALTEEEIQAIVADRQSELGYPPLPPDVNGMASDSKECFRRIQAIMNAYSKTRSLKKTTPVDGVWSAASISMWQNPFVKHVFTAHPTFSSLSFADSVRSGQMTGWKALSKSMISNYPGYTEGPMGCLAFCLDAYYGNTVYGETVPAGGGEFFDDEEPEEEISGGQAQTSPPPSGGGGAAAVAPAAAASTRTARDTGSGIRSASEIFIGVDFDNAAVDEASSEIKDPTARRNARNAMINATDLKAVFEDLNRTLQIRLVGDMGGQNVFTRGRKNLVQNQENIVIRIRKARLGFAGIAVDIVRGSPRKIFDNFKKTVKDVLEDESIVIPGLLPAFYGCVMDIVVPRGYYQKIKGREQEAGGNLNLSENAEIRKLVRQAIIKEYLNG